MPRAVRRKPMPEMESAFVRCRTLGHAWSDISGLGPSPAHRITYLQGQRVMLRCSSCGTCREDVWAKNDGHLIHRNYTYPDSYHLAVKVTRSDFRRKYLTTFAELFA